MYCIFCHGVNFLNHLNSYLIPANSNHILWSPFGCREATWGLRSDSPARMEGHDEKHDSYQHDIGTKSHSTQFRISHIAMLLLAIGRTFRCIIGALILSWGLLFLFACNILFVCSFFQFSIAHILIFICFNWLNN